MTTVVPKLEDSSGPFAASKSRLENSDKTLKAKLNEVHRLNRLLAFGEDEAMKTQRAERVAKLAAGEKVEPVKSVKAQLEDAKNELADMEEAYSYQAKQHEALRESEGQKLRASLVPAVAAEEKKIASALVDIYSALSSIEKVKNGLLAQGLGWWGAPVTIETERLFDSLDRGSNIAVVLRQCAAKGYISLPKGL